MKDWSSTHFTATAAGLQGGAHQAQSPVQIEAPSTGSAPLTAADTVSAGGTFMVQMPPER